MRLIGLAVLVTFSLVLAPLTAGSQQSSGLNSTVKTRRPGNGRTRITTVATSCALTSRRNEGHMVAIPLAMLRDGRGVDVLRERGGVENEKGWMVRVGEVR